MPSLHSMRNMLKLNPSNDILDYVIKSKHKVLSVIRDNQAILMFPVSEYLGILYDPETNLAKIIYRSFNEEKEVVIDFNQKDSDLLGFSDMDAACDHLYSDETLIIRPIKYAGDEFKLIFSPQLAKWLIRHRHLVWDIKENRNKSNEIIFVFKVDENFYEDVEEFRNQNNKDK